MERNREARRASILGSNGFNRRRNRTNGLRRSPDEGSGVQLQESVRLRDRVKKDRDRERKRDKAREREIRERSCRSKRRRAGRLMSNREDTGGDETSEESVNDDDDDEEEETSTVTTGARLLPPTVGSISEHHHSHPSNHHHSHSSSLSQQQNSNSSDNIGTNNRLLQHRKSFPPGSSSSKVFRAAPVWKPGDEMIGVSVPRKARSASTKRSHDWISSGCNNNSGVGPAGREKNRRQVSSSPVRQDLGSKSIPCSAPAAPMSPSSYNALFRKKLKPSWNIGGPKLKPPKASSKRSSSNPEALEIEIAEVLYGLRTQSQGPSANKEDSREDNRSSSDTKSHVSSHMSNTNSANNQISGSKSVPLLAVALKRKRPRQVVENSSCGARSSPFSTKLEMDQAPKTDVSAPNTEKISGFTTEMGGNSANSQGQPLQPPEMTVPEPTKLDSEFKPVAEELRESRDLVAKENMSSPNEKESSAVKIEDNVCTDSTSTATASVSATMIKSNPIVSEEETQREQKLEIDLMAPPPQVRSSPKREIEIHLKAAAMDQKPVPSSVDAELAPVVSEDEEDEKVKSEMENSANVEAGEGKGEGTGEEDEPKKEIETKSGSIDLQFDLEKLERNETAGVNATGNKLQQEAQKRQQQEIQAKISREEPLTEKSGQSNNSLPLPMPMASWPAGPSPMGYVAPLQGVVSMDGSTVPPAPIQPLLSQPRPKRCATHRYIAKNIQCLQQCMKMNPFWQVATGPASLFGSKSCNLNLMPTDLHGNMASRGLNIPQDKGQILVSSPNCSVKDKGSQTACFSDSAQRKQQILIQQALPPLAPSNLLGPAFIVPVNQQQAAVAAASARPSSVESASTTGGVASSNTSCSASGISSAAPAEAATAMSFNYPGVALNESQYLAVLQNNAYPFGIPAAVGPPPNYRGTPAQAMPLFNGSFYSSQIIHSAQVQHQQAPSAQSPHLHQQANQNATVSGSSAPSPKPSQQQRPQSTVVNAGIGSTNLHNFPSQKSLQLQQSHNQPVYPSGPRHLEGDLGSGNKPTADSSWSQASTNIFGQNFPITIPPQNFALMPPLATFAGAAAVSGSNNQIEKKPQQPQQSLPPLNFAVSSGPINVSNVGPGIDIASMPQNHAIFQSFPQVTPLNIQMMAAAAAAQAAPKKNFKTPQDNKSGCGDSSATDDELKTLAAKAQGGVGQSDAFMRSELAHAPVSSLQANGVIESSGRLLNVGSGNLCSSEPVTISDASTICVSNAHIQGQFQQQQELQLKQLQQLATNAASWSKAPVNDNGSIFPEHLNSSSPMAANFPNALYGFPPSLVQSHSSPAQSSRLKSTARASTSQTPSSLASSTAALKSLPQRPSGNRGQMHTQISFGGNQKQSMMSQGQAPSNSNLSPSASTMVGSPTNSSISKEASGDHRTTTSVSTNKMGPSSSLSSQQLKSSLSVVSQKTPVAIGIPQVASSAGSRKSPMPQHLQMQQQLHKTMQPGQLIFSNLHSQGQSPHSSSTSSTMSGRSGFYMQQRQPEQQQQRQPAQQPPVVRSTSSTGVLSLCPPVTLAGTSTTDPAKAFAAATSNAKGGGLPAGLSYIHPVPAAVQVKPAEQKQPAS